MAKPYADRLTTMQDSLDKLSAAIDETQTKRAALTEEKLRNRHGGGASQRACWPNIAATTAPSSRTSSNCV